MSESERPPDSASRIIRQRRFLPFFCTQFLGAFNDNVFKNALTNLIVFQPIIWVPLAMQDQTGILVNLGAMVFILPYFLFSALAGQFADKYSKALLIRRVKMMEVVVMGFAALALWSEQLVLLFVLLFLMGTQSTLFGPAKYAYMPEYLRDDELLAGNGLVEMGTFIAILVGTIYAGMLVSLGDAGKLAIIVSVLGFAVLGYLASCKIPAKPAASPELHISPWPWMETLKILRFAREDRLVFICILGISWFWAYGSVYMAQIYGYTRDVLGGGERQVVVLLTAFSLGIGVGSMLCEKLSGGRARPGVVALGLLGIAVFGIHLAMVSPVPGMETHALKALWESGGWIIAVDLLGVGLFGGLLIVTLYTIVQQRSPVERRSRIIAANNIINSLAMVLASIWAILILAVGLDVRSVFLSTALLHIIVSVLLLRAYPNFFQDFMTWFATPKK